MRNEAQATQQPVPLPQVPELYVNRAGITVSPYDILIECALEYPRRYAPTLVPQVRIRMSLQHAWAFSKVLDRVLRQYIEAEGPIHLPEAMVKDLGLEDEYRREMGAKT